MATRESLQKKLDRVRPPRVQITYDVEIGDAIEMKELPFVLGVMGDFVGKPEDPLPSLKQRKFVEIDPDNFNAVMAGMKPRLAYTIENKLQDDGSKMGVELNFNNIEDFEPDQIVFLTVQNVFLNKIKVFFDVENSESFLLDQIFYNLNNGKEKWYVYNH